MNTSSIIVLFCALAITMVIGNHEQFHEAIVKCKQELSVDDAMIENADKNDTDNEDPKMKCWGACMMKQLGTMTSKGVIVKEKAIEMVPTDMKNREKLIDAIETCSGEYGADECETARKVRFCILAKVPIFKHL